MDQKGYSYDYVATLCHKAGRKSTSAKSLEHICEGRVGTSSRYAKFLAEKVTKGALHWTQFIDWYDAFRARRRKAA